MKGQAARTGGLKSRGRITFVAVAAALLSVILASTVLGADFELASSEGIWTDADISVSGINTSDIRWGTSTGSGQSGFDFDGNFSESFNSGETFLIGTFTHHNNPIYGDAPTSLELEITLQFNSPAISPDPTFTYVLGFDETSNDPDNHPGGVCPYGGDYNGCYDRVTFPGGSSDTFWAGDTKYTLEILGFTTSPTGGTPVIYFDTVEQQDNVAYVVGRLTIVCTRPAVLDEPDNITVYETEDVQFVVSASGSSLSYQWYKDGTPLSNGGDISGATTDTLTITNVDASHEGDYKVRLSNDCDTVYSNVGILTVLPPDCANYAISYSGSSYNGTNTTFTYTVTSYQPPEISHWVLGVGDCITSADIVSAGPGPIAFGTDPTTGIYGIKFDSSVPEGETYTFTVTLSGYWAEATTATESAIKAATKAGQKICVYSTTGPSCRRADLELAKTVDESAPLMGSDITYTITINNNGPSAATGVEVTDLLPSGLDYVSDLPSQGTYSDTSGIWSVGTLSSGGTATLRITATVLGSGDYENTAEVTDSDVPDPDSTPNNHVPSEDDQDSVTITPVATPEIAVAKESNHPAGQVGKTIVYTYTVTNPGNVPLSVSLSDDLLGTIAGPVSGDTNSNGFLDATETWIYEKSYVIDFEDRNSFVDGSYYITNVATVEGTAPDSSVVSDVTDETIRICTVNLSVEKTGPAIAAVGDLITYTIVVTNSGPMDKAISVILTDVLPDSLSGATYVITSGGSGSGVWTGSLDLGDMVYPSSITIEITATIDPSASGSLVNQACISNDVYDPDDSDDCDSTTTIVDYNPALLVLKSSDSASALVGDIVNYTVTVQHHETSDGSPVYITDVTDSLGIALSGPTGDDGDGLLEESEIWTYIGSRAVLANDPHELVNTVCISGLDYDEEAVSDCDSTTTIVEHEPVLEVQKSGLPTTASVGDTVDYTITVQHAPSSDGSPVDITDVADSLGITLSGPVGDNGDGLLEDGETWTYTGSREVLPVDPESLINEVCVEGEDFDGDLVGDCDSTTTTVVHEPVLLVQKSGVPSIANVGNTIAYMITVQHDSISDNSPVDITSVNDSLGIVLSGPSGDDGDGLLEEGEVWTYTGSREVLPSDPESLVNEVCAEGQDLDGDTVSDCGDTTTTVRHSPVLKVEKTGDPAAAAVGDTVTYTITVQHDISSDGSPIDITAVNDSLGVVLSGPTGDDGDRLLESNETWTYTGSRVAQALDPHELTNTVCVDGLDLDGDPVEDCDSTTTLVSHPDIEVTKTADVAFAGIGDTVTYTYLVENTGDVDLYSIVLDDDILGIIAGPVSGDDGDDILEIHETWIYEKSHIVVEGDLPGPLVNLATVTGTPQVGNPVQDTNTETVQLTSQPSIDLIKNASSGPFAVGDTVTYTYDVTNTGDVTLTNLTLVDDKLGSIGLGSTTLAPNASTTGSGTHVVTQADMDAGSILNTAVVEGVPSVGPSVSDQDDETVILGQTPSIEVIKDSSDGPFAVDETITYTYTITNTGNVTLTSITVVDDILGPISLGATTLAPNASTTGSATHVVTQADVDAGTLVNLAEVSGNPPFGSPVSDEDDEIVDFGHSPQIEIIKSASSGPFSVGDTITYTYDVTNTGNVTLTSITVVDDILGPISLGATTLAPNATTTGSATHIVTQADIDTGFIVNIATATGTPPAGPPVTDEEDETVDFGQTPAIEVIKDASDGPFTVGDTILYSYVVTNTGNVTLSDIELEDDILGIISLEDSTLAPGGVTSGTATHVVTQIDIDTGSIVNIATVSSVAPDQSTVTDNDDETVAFGQTPLIEVSKTASDGPFIVGDTISYTYVVTNTGTVTLTNINVVDDILGSVTLLDSTLAPGESTTGQATHMVTQADVNSGSIVNVATASGTPPSGPPITDIDDETVEFALTPQIEIVKTASDGPFIVGNTITYNYVVTNTGNVTLTNVFVVDDILGPITLGDTSLEPNASTTGQASHVVTQADVDAGEIVNIATVTGTSPDQSPVTDQDEETVPFGQTPDIEVIKSASDGPFVVGDMITYSYVVTNIGNVTLTGVTLSDDILGSISLGAATLAPNASTTGTATHVVTQADVDASEIINVADVSGIAPNQSTVTDTDDEVVTFGQTPQIEVAKTASDGPFIVGDTIVYAYTVTNAGNVTLTSISLADDILGPISLGATTLLPGASTTGQAMHVVTQTDIDTGSIVNVATATGTPPFGPPVTDDDDEVVDFGQSPQIEVIKTASDGPFTVGDTITYTYVVTNTGNVTLISVALVDDKLGTITLGVTTLAPDGSTNGQATHVVTQADIDHASLTNIATVTGVAPDQSTVADEDDETVPFGQIPAIEVVKSASDGPFTVGDTIIYSYVVTNTGNVTLTTVALVDDKLGSITLGVTSLAPNASTNGQATHVVTQADIDDASLTNIATVTGVSPDQSTVTDEDDEIVPFGQTPAIEVVKSASDGPFVVGDTITYSYVVTNIGTVTLTSVTLADDLLGSISLGATTLAPNASTSGQATHVVTQTDVDAGSIINVADVTGTAPDQSTVTDDDVKTVLFGQEPQIEVVKTASDGPFTVGDTITYTYVVTNIGNVSLTTLSLEDDKLGSIDLGTTTLAPNASTTGSAIHIVTQADVDAASLLNVATVTGVAPDQSTVTDDDGETVNFGQTPQIEVVKNALGESFVVGDTITYSYVVTNTGNVTLTNVALTDDILGSISLGVTTLAPNASTTSSAAHLVTQSDVDTGSIVNIATVTGTAPDQSTVTDDDDETVDFGQTPQIEVVKTASDGPTIVGDIIVYTYDVANTGNVTLTNVTLVDDILGSITLGVTTLAPNASTTGSANHVVTQADVDAGSIINVATATGRPPSGSTVADDDEETVSFGQTPQIEVVKTASDGPTIVGDTITYAYNVANTGNVTLTNVALVDDILGPITLGSTTLAPNASTIGSATHIVTQADVDAGSIVNVATVTGTAPDQSTVSDDDDEIVPFGQIPQIEVVKTASDGPFAVGDTITYTYDVANTGNVTLTNVALVDDILGPITLGSTTLAPNASTIGSATHIVTQADVDAGSIVNVATVTGTAPDQSTVTDDADEIVSFGRTPQIEVVKTASDGPFAVGDTITYTYDVANTGNVTLINVALVDDILGAIGLGATTLPPNASTTGSATHIVTQIDVDSGSIVNVASVTGTAPDQATVTDDDQETVPFGQTAAIEVIKTASEGPFIAGNTITYLYTVTNVGTVTLTNITLVDDKLGAISLDATALIPDESTSGSAEHVVTQDDIDSGSLVNIANVTGTAPDQSTVTDDDEKTVTFGQTPQIEVIKTASGGPFIVGDTITYIYDVANTGNVTLTSVALVDDILGAIGLGATTLVPNASTTGSATHIVTQADIDSGSIYNVATASGVPPSGPPVTDEEDEIVDFGQTPQIEIVKTASDGPTVVGDTITYSYVVTNTGNVTLTSVALVDDKLGAIGLGATTLAPDASTTGSATHVVTQANVDAGSIVNIATVAGTAPDQSSVTDTDDENVTFAQAPSLSIDKTGDEGPLRVSEIINYQITVTNTGNITLHNVTVTDPMLGMSQNLGTLAPGASQLIAGIYGPVSENDLPGPLVNVAIADSDETTPVEDDHSVEVLPIGIDLSLTKTVDNVNPEVGDIVTFEIIVANGPNFADATNVEVTDTLPAGYAFVGFAVDQGTYAYTGFNSVWIVGDLPSGSSATLQVFATVLEAGPYVSPAEVTAADQDDIDSVPANADVLTEDDDDEAVVFIDTPIADLLVIKTVDNANPNEEEPVVFTISVYNGGPYTSTGILLRDALPVGLTYVSDTSGGAYNPATNAWDVGDLIVGESSSFTMSALVDVGTAGTTLTNTALIIQNEIDDPSPANNQASADVTVGELVAGGGGTDNECDGIVVISEIAWAGTAANPDDEWIELRNIGGEPVDVTGWVLRWRMKQPITPEDFEWKIIPLSGVLQASSTPVCEIADLEPESSVEFVKREVDDLSWFVEARPVDYDDSYMILERKSDLTISNVDADIIYDDVSPYTMELSDDGDIIELLNADGIVVDTANAFPSYEGNWPAGDEITRGTMERIDLLGEDEPNNWHTNLGIVTQGLDADGRPLIASADLINSQTLEEMELFIDLNATKTLPGARLEVGLDLSRETRIETGWPWIRITRPGYEASADAVGGGGGVEPAYSFASRYANDTYWLGIDTAGLVPGNYLVWVVYGEGQTILVPITILD